MTRRARRWLLVLGSLLAVAVFVWVAFLRSPPDDTRWNGAYRLADGRLVLIAAREGPVLRYRLLDGESSPLWPVGEDRYEAGPGFAERTPVQIEVGLRRDAAGRISGTWGRGGREQRLERLALPEEVFTFPSGELALRGKLVTPAGSGPFPAVVLVHGAESTSAVDTYWEPYLFAAHGIAALVFDKRGTGESDGRYTQNFPVLAGDVVAAVERLRSRPEIDAARIHLAGFSQGGWIAPLAAARTPGIRSLLIGFGPMVSAAEEDRWGYVYALRRKGLGEDAVAAADRVNAVLARIVDHEEDRWGELDRLLEETEGEPWREAVAGSDSTLGMTTGTRLPLWAMRLVVWGFRMRHRDAPFIDRLYDPLPTVAALDVPSLWILGGKDESMPTDWTVKRLDDLRGRGRPVEYFVYPEADHGILRFVEGPEGRRYLGHERDYLPRMVGWIREHSAG